MMKIYEIILNQSELTAPVNLGFVINATKHEVVTKFAFTKTVDRSRPLKLLIHLNFPIDPNDSYVFATADDIRLPLKDNFYYVIDVQRSSGSLDSEFIIQQNLVDEQDAKAFGIIL